MSSLHHTCPSSLVWTVRAPSAVVNSTYGQVGSVGLRVAISFKTYSFQILQSRARCAGLKALVGSTAFAV